MNPKQRSIKTFAIALAAMFAVIIIGAIILGARSILNFTSPAPSNSFTDGIYYDETFDTDDFSEIIINNGFGKLFIESGDEFRVIGHNLLTEFSCKIDKDALVIKHVSKKNMNFTNFAKTNITITIPEGMEFKLIEIETGVDDCDINDIEVSEFVLTAGVGDVTISSLTSSDTRIEGGVGDIDIINSELGNFSLECGVGDTEIEGSLADCIIHSGVGDIDLAIDGDFEDYDIDMTTGVGEIRIDGERYKKNSRLNKGAKYSFEISGGVGDIDINFN